MCFLVLLFLETLRSYWCLWVKTFKRCFPMWKFIVNFRRKIKIPRTQLEKNVPKINLKFINLVCAVKYRKQHWNKSLPSFQISFRFSTHFIEIYHKILFKDHLNSGFCLFFYLKNIYNCISVWFFFIFPALSLNFPLLRFKLHAAKNGLNQQHHVICTPMLVVYAVSSRATRTNSRKKDIINSGRFESCSHGLSPCSWPDEIIAAKYIKYIELKLQ